LKLLNTLVKLRETEQQLKASHLPQKSQVKSFLLYPWKF